MKVRIKKYKNWISPYNVFSWLENPINKLFPKVTPNNDSFFGNKNTAFDRFCDFTFPFFKLLEKIRGERYVRVKIEKFDTWNMDSTLALIILPMLKQLQETKRGCPGVDDEDVPEDLRAHSEDPYSTEGWEEKWDWVMSEMIWAFEQYGTDWQSQFHTGKISMGWKELEDGTSQLVRGEDDTSHWDREGQQKYQDRINNGFILFGKYYQGLWD